MPKFNREFLVGSLTSFDAFGQPVQLRVNGRRYYKTGCGAIFTCFAFLFTLWFLLHLILLYVQRSDQLRMHHKTLQPGDEPNHVHNLTFFAGETTSGRFVHEEWGRPDRETLQQETAKSHKFNVAFGLSDFADRPDNVEDSRYGNLVAQQTYRLEDGTLQYRPIETQGCESDYLEQMFYPARPHVQQRIEFNSAKLKCLSPSAENLAVFGEYDETQSSSFSIFFSSCDTLWNSDCASIEEVTEWLSHKYIIMMFTERRFSHTTGREIEETRMVRLPINKVTNTHYRFQLEVTHLINLDNLNNTIWPSGNRFYEDFYRVIQLADQPYVEPAQKSQFTEYYPNRFQVSFEIAPEQLEVHVLPQFTAVEIMASIGGLLFIAFIVGNSIFSLYANFLLENQLMTRLYKNQDLKQAEDDTMDKDLGGDIEQAKRGAAPWGFPKRGSVKIVDFNDRDRGKTIVPPNQSETIPTNPIVLDKKQSDGMDEQFEGGQKISELRSRQSFDDWKAYLCCGKTPLRKFWTKEGKAARIGKMKLRKHLEVSRILKNLTHTKTAVELMLMPDTQGRFKAEKKLYPVCSELQEVSDSSEEEENMLMLAYEKANADEDITSPKHFFSSRLGSTRRGLMDSFKTNEAGEAFYDSERGNNLMDQVTDSQMSLQGQEIMSASLKSNRTFSRGSRGSKKGKKGRKSHASIVLEEPSKEDHGFAFQSRYSIGNSGKSSSKNMNRRASGIASSINIRISRKSLSSNKTGSPIKRTLSGNGAEMQSTVKSIEQTQQASSPSKKKSMRSSTKSPMRQSFKSTSKSPIRILAQSNSRSPSMNYSAKLGLSPRQAKMPSPLRDSGQITYSQPRTPFTQSMCRPLQAMGNDSQNLRRSIFDQPSEVDRPGMTTFIQSREKTPPKLINGVSLQNQMLSRLSKKTAPQEAGRKTSIDARLRVSPYMPRHYNGDFRALGPVNPQRQRMTVDQSTISKERFPSNDSDPYANVIIYGDANKLFGPAQLSTERKASNSSNNDGSTQRRICHEIKTQNSSNATGGPRYAICSGEPFSRQVEMGRIYEQSSQAESKNIALAKSSFSNNADSEFAQINCLSGNTSHANYVPPPSAPHKLRNKGKKLFTTVQPKATGLIDETGGQGSAENSQSPGLVISMRREQAQRVGKAMINESWAKELMVHRSIVIVPDQKLGASRTRVILSQDDLSGAKQPAPAGKFKVDNYLVPSSVVHSPTNAPKTNPVMTDEDQVEIGRDSIIENNYPGHTEGDSSELQQPNKHECDAPFEESKMLESKEI